MSCESISFYNKMWVCDSICYFLHYSDPKLRPTFAEIMALLKPLQKPITGSQAHRASVHAHSSRSAEDPAAA